MDDPLPQFTLYLLFLLACALLSRWLPPLLGLGHRHEHPWVAVRGGRDLLGEDVDVVGQESKLPGTV